MNTYKNNLYKNPVNTIIEKGLLIRESQRYASASAIIEQGLLIREEQRYASACDHGEVSLDNKVAVIEKNNENKINSLKREQN